MKPTKKEPTKRRIAHRRSWWETEFDPADFEPDVWYMYQFDKKDPRESINRAAALRRWLKDLGLKSPSEDGPYDFEITQRSAEGAVYVTITKKGLIKARNGIKDIN